VLRSAGIVSVSGPNASGIHLKLLPRSPLDTVTCGGNVDPPYETYRGGTVIGSANIFCSPHAPDVCSVTVRVWRYDATQKKYYLLSENTSNSCGTNWWVSTQWKCIAQNPWAMHTQVQAQLFYGNWIYLNGNSKAVTLYC
jgi:hypothetical protein